MGRHQDWAHHTCLGKLCALLTMQSIDPSQSLCCKGIASPVSQILLYLRVLHGCCSQRSWKLRCWRP